MFRWWSDHKEKRKSKRDAAKLALYRDWPPYLVDTFIEYQENRFIYESPKEYPSWVSGESYEVYKSGKSAYKNVRMYRR